MDMLLLYILIALGLGVQVYGVYVMRSSRDVAGETIQSLISSNTALVDKLMAVELARASDDPTAALRYLEATRLRGRPPVEEVELELPVAPDAIAQTRTARLG